MWNWIKRLWNRPTHPLIEACEKHDVVEGKQILDCPKLSQVLGIIGRAVVQQHQQPGGPDQNKTMELSVDCSDDPVLRQVLEIKGGELGIIIRLKAPVVDPNEVDPAFSERMRHMRAIAGIKEADMPVGVIT